MPASTFKATVIFPEEQGLGSYSTINAVLTLGDSEPLQNSHSNDIQLQVTQDLGGKSVETAIFRAMMRSVPADNSEVFKDVVIKISVADSEKLVIRREAEFYQRTLKPYYGQGVPTFYGLYEGTQCDSLDPNCKKYQCTFLVLEWCVDPIEPFITLGRKFRCVSKTPANPSKCPILNL
ncbi:hypothetical protein DXG03_003924 [Asterophora parasitica]|uniref:Uncharacterized protein n=1 Tax=Asterophora parasitica TaxID=117018 RepID=A0A9P7KAC6_9AGAR|nr:hypothetical protein DXG03_003924 [Asterophora parasitica]